MHERILVVEDEIEMSDALALHLGREGYQVTVAGDGLAALQAASREKPDLILLDLVLPQISGTEVCRRLKAGSGTRDIPIIVLSAKRDECDVVLGLGLGAEDYIAKPFRPRELLARIEVVLGRRRSVLVEEPPPDRIEIGNLVIDTGRYEVDTGDGRVSLTATEMRLLELLASDPGRVFTRTQLLGMAANGGDPRIAERNVDVHIRGIRKKIGKQRDPIETVRGVGYRLRPVAS